MAAIQSVRSRAIDSIIAPDMLGGDLVTPQKQPQKLLHSYDTMSSADKSSTPPSPLLSQPQLPPPIVTFDPTKETTKLHQLRMQVHAQILETADEEFERDLIRQEEEHTAKTEAERKAIEKERNAKTWGKVESGLQLFATGFMIASLFGGPNPISVTMAAVYVATALITTAVTVDQQFNDGKALQKGADIVGDQFGCDKQGKENIALAASIATSVLGIVVAFGSGGVNTEGLMKVLSTWQPAAQILPSGMKNYNAVANCYHQNGSLSHEKLAELFMAGLEKHTLDSGSIMKRQSRLDSAVANNLSRCTLEGSAYFA